MAKKKQPAPEPQENPEFNAKLNRIGKRNGNLLTTDEVFSSEKDSVEMVIDGTSKKVVIKKAKINKELFLDVSYHESIILISGTKRRDIGSTISREGENAIHDDLKNAFAKLHPHLALLSEMIEADDLVRDYFDNHETEVDAEQHAIWNKGWQDFKVTGFSIGGNGDTEGVTLIGQKTLSNGKILNLTTPFEKWDGSEYAYINELAVTIEECKHEVELYLNGKMAPPAQTEMDFEAGEAEKTEAAEA